MPFERPERLSTVISPGLADSILFPLITRQSSGPLWPATCSAVGRSTWCASASIVRDLMTRRTWLFVLPLTILLTGCGNSDTDTPTAPSPTGPLVSETFAGTVAPLGQSFHAFNVAENSDVSAQLTAAGPPSTIYMLLSLGAVSGSTCTPLNNATVLVQAGTTPQLTGSINVGSYCVIVADAGNQLQNVSYSVVVNHY